MDKASLTIDRHTPIIPESLWYGMPPTLERVYTRTKNKFILPTSEIEQITRWRGVQGNKFPNEEKREITEEMLQKAEFAVHASVGILSEETKAHLINRGVTQEEIRNWKMCETADLLEFLDDHTVDNLTLRIPAKFKSIVTNTEITGISIPYYRDGRLCGFVTRVLGEESLKYCVTVPNRLCFGTDFNKNEVFVVEGVFDAIAMRAVGNNPLGMADSQPNFYKMWAANTFDVVNLLFDPDYAGWLGAIKAYIILTRMLNRDPDSINILELDGADPERLIRESGQLFSRKITFEDAVARAEDLGSHLTSEDMLL